MKKLSIIFLFLTISFNTCFGITPPIKTHFIVSEANYHSLLFSQIREANIIKPYALLQIYQLEKKKEQNLILKVINWDCKLKVRLNKNLNFVVYYN